MRVKLKPIEQQALVVFGASSGIGRQTALDLARRGARICVAARSESGLFSLVEEIYQIKKQCRNSAEAFAVVADAADFAEVKAVADAAVAEFGRLDSWIHCAGTFLFAKFEQIAPEEFRRVVEVNLLGQVWGAMAALPHLRERGGALIHVTSVEALRTVPLQSAYGASKHGVHGFLQALRVELAHDQTPVVVTEILPAAINTPIYDKGKNKMPFKPRPVPPIYQPNVVSRAILYALENPTRSLIAGGAGLGVALAERLSPALTDKISGAVGFIGQTSNKPADDNQADSLFTATGDFDTVRGRFDRESFAFDLYTFAATSKSAQNALLIAAAGALGWFVFKRFRKLKN